jgi:hypothetical protein
MTTTTPAATATPPRRAAAHARRRTLSEAAQILTFGNLAWLGLVWLAVTVVYAGVVACVARWGSIEESLWQSVVAGWQRYVIFGAGVTIATTFMRMLVRNGVTRRTLSGAAAIAMGVIGVAVALWNVAGYAVEHVVYDANGWPQTLRSDTEFEWGDLPRAAIDSGLVAAAYYAVGWIVGICFYRWRFAGGMLRLLPALVPAALMELLVSPDFGGIDIDVLTTWRERPPVLVTLVLGGVLLAGIVWVARRLTVAAAVH